MAGRSRVRRSLDRRAPQRRLGDNSISRGIHCDRGRPHAPHPPGHWRSQPALPPSLYGGKSDGVAGPPDQRARDARRWARSSGVRREHVLHRPGTPTGDDGRVAGSDHAAPGWQRTSYLRYRLVQIEGCNATTKALSETDVAGGGGLGPISRSECFWRANTESR